MRVRDKRRKHYLKHGWRKFLDSWFAFKYEVICTDLVEKDGQYAVKIKVKERTQ